MIYSQFYVLVSPQGLLRRDCIIWGIPLSIDYINEPFRAYLIIRIFVKSCIIGIWNVSLLSTMMKE